MFVSLRAKRFLKAVFGLLVGLIFWGAVAHANNTFPGTTISGVTGSISASNTAATGEPGEPVPPFPSGNVLHTMWYSWTAPSTGTVTFETCGTTAPSSPTTFDTVLGAYTGTAVNALTTLVQNDDTTGCAVTGQANYGSRVIFNVVSGSTYRLQVDGYASATGTFRLQWFHAAFNITKTASLASISAPGTITYTISVQNVGAQTLTGLTISDTLLLGTAPRTLTSGPTLTSGDTNGNGQIETTETFVYTATFAVPQSDIDLGGTYSNTATFDTTQTAPKTSNAATTLIVRTPNIEVVKSWAFNTPGGDVNSNGIVDAGDTLRYTYAVTNIGNVTLSNVNVIDAHLGAGSLSPITPASVASLAPAATTNFTSTYVVLQQDIDNQ